MIWGEKEIRSLEKVSLKRGSTSEGYNAKDSTLQNSKFLHGSWKSPRIITALQKTDISSPRELPCFGGWTL